MAAFRYGIFKRGQIWTINGDDGVKLGFPSRDAAIAAVVTMVSVHRACGQTAVVTTQDEVGRLRTLLNPLHEAALDRVANDDAWEILLGAAIPRSQPINPAAANSQEP